MATELKHTSGPWATEYDRGDIHIIGPDFVGGSQTIATVYTRSNGPDCEAVADANARLIAASPDLLEALQETVAKFDAAPDSVKYTALGINKCRAAIAKATGQ